MIQPTAKTAQTVGTPSPNGEQSSVRRQVRGSSLLLLGRSCSILLNLATQVAIIRYLTKAEFGALAYTISIVEMASLGAALCMDKTFSRYGAVYHEQRDRERFLGAWLLSMVVPVGLGALMIGAVYGGRELIADWLQFEPLTLSLLLAMVWMIPLNAISSVTLSLATVVRGARTVFFRKHLFAPIVKLALVLGVVYSGGTPQHLVGALLLAGLGGLATDTWIVSQVVRREKLWRHLRLRPGMVPFRELFGFSLPLLSSDLAYLARGTLIVVLLGWLASSECTASFRAVLPVVRLNELVIVNFTLMFTPLASRLFARGATDELGDLYVRTRTWIMMVSFPIFAGCVALSCPLTVLMFGAEYADASLLLVTLVSGYYVQACYGFSGRLLKVLGHVRPLVVIDISSAAVAIVAAWLLIPELQAVGAAVAVTIGIILHCTLKTRTLRRFVPRTGSFTSPRRPQLVAMLTAAALVALSVTTSPGWLGGVLITIAGTATVWWICWHSLDLEAMFPEIRRIPGVGGTSSMQHAALSSEKRTDRSDGPLRIAYMMSRFPKITETFVLGEMVEMERLGCVVEVFPLRRERTRFVHPQAQSFVDIAYFTPWLSPRILLSNIKYLLSDPALYSNSLATLIRANSGSLRYLSGAMLFFPKAVHLADVMRQRQIQHLHAHFASHPAAVAWVINRLAGIPYSFTAHGSDLHRDRHMLREKAAGAAAVITISNYNRQIILNECTEVPPDRVRVIHCGVDSRVFTPRSEPTLFELGRAPLQIGCIGTLHEVKGQRHLLAACAELKRRGHGSICHLIGDGPDDVKLRSIAAELHVLDDVKFHGRRTAPEIRRLLQEFDVLVAPSVPTRCGRREGIPVVLMEAMASGVPVIASDLSGIPELVHDGSTGLLTAPGDCQAIADALERLACDRSLGLRLAEAGRVVVLREFDLAHNAEQLKNVIESLRCVVDSAPAPADRTTDQSDTVRNVEGVCLC